jgi:prevent-host-death family protein
MARKQEGVMGQVSVYEARNNLSQLIKAAQRGEEVVIASRGTPVARLVPITSGPAGGLAAWFAAHPVPPGGRTRQEIDTAIAEERDSWD